MRPPDPIPEPSQIGDVPQAVAEAIDSLARLRARTTALGLASTDTAVPTTRTTGLTEGAMPADAGTSATPIGGGGAADARRDGRAAEAAARATLRQAVERYARDLRRQGVPPERMIVAVKGVVKRATASAHPLPEPEYLIPDLVQWSIAAYFAAD
jgi:hypothetical protein